MHSEHFNELTLGSTAKNPDCTSLLSLMDDHRRKTQGSWAVSLHYKWRLTSGKSLWTIFMTSLSLLTGNKKHWTFVSLVEMKDTKIGNSSIAIHTWFCSNQLWEGALGAGFLVWPPSAGIEYFFSLFSSPCDDQTSSPFLLPPISSPLASGKAEKMAAGLLSSCYCLPFTEDPWVYLPASVSETSPSETSPKSPHGCYHAHSFLM